MAASSSHMLRCALRRICLSVNVANQRSTRLIQEALVGVKCTRKRGVPPRGGSLDVCHTLRPSLILAINPTGPCRWTPRPRSVFTPEGSQPTER